MPASLNFFVTAFQVAGVGDAAPLGEFLHRGLPLGLLLRGELGAPAAGPPPAGWPSAGGAPAGAAARATGRAAAAASECRHRGRACQCFAMVRHQFGLAEPDFDIRLDDGFRIRTGDAIEAVGDGADLNAAELRIDLLRAKRPGKPARRPARSFPNLVL